MASASILTKEDMASASISSPSNPPHSPESSHHDLSNPSNIVLSSQSHRDESLVRGNNDLGQSHVQGDNNPEKAMFDLMLWSGDHGEEEEVLSGFSKEGTDEINTNEDGNEAMKNCEERVEEPDVGMEFNTPNEAYLYYSRFAKEKGFVVAKRSSGKGKDGVVRHVILQCSKGGKARARGSNPIKTRPQTKVDSPAHLKEMEFYLPNIAQIYMTRNKFDEKEDHGLKGRKV
ncbi:uncharacterized protein A4U43_C01F1070 [Asparagus officinalis]|uniref:FAR1 domain-containing protein n=1 Tax=Asparagus officinalis TaxID=4686 RepID=A0A5P1FKS2_ASPOF|nr:uncharacterized protein A4U43_C01F1070 [Asparagus officinalis]